MGFLFNQSPFQISHPWGIFKIIACSLRSGQSENGKCLNLNIILIQKFKGFSKYMKEKCFRFYFHFISINIMFVKIGFIGYNREVNTKCKNKIWEIYLRKIIYDMILNIIYIRVFSHKTESENLFG